MDRRTTRKEVLGGARPSQTRRPSVKLKFANIFSSSGTDTHIFGDSEVDFVMLLVVEIKPPERLGPRILPQVFVVRRLEQERLRQRRIIGSLDRMM